MLLLSLSCLGYTPPVMATNTSNSPADDENQPTGEAAEQRGKKKKSPLSLERLSEAFATMLSPREKSKTVPQRAGEPAVGKRTPDSTPQRLATNDDGCAISPKSIVEAMLFVGKADNSPIAAEEIAASMRDITPSEIDHVVEQLNAIYAEDGSPYSIIQLPTGYRLTLSSDFDRLRDKLIGRVRESKLSATAIEVLSIIAYQQPITTEQVNELRGTPSGGLLNQLVRRKLVRVDRDPHQKSTPTYGTTDRFLQLFRIQRIEDLPQNEASVVG